MYQMCRSEVVNIKRIFQVRFGLSLHFASILHIFLDIHDETLGLIKPDNPSHWAHLHIALF